MEDNPAFNKACKNGEVLPIYIFDKKYWELETSSSFHLKFIQDSLDELNQVFKEKFNSQLYIFYGDTLEIFKELISKNKFENIYSNQIFRNHYTLNLVKNVQFCLRKKYYLGQEQQFGIQLENRKRTSGLLIGIII